MSEEHYNIEAIRKKIENDRLTAKAVQKMADEGERDIKKKKSVIEALRQRADEKEQELSEKGYTIEANGIKLDKEEATIEVLESKESVSDGKTLEEKVTENWHGIKTPTEPTKTDTDKAPTKFIKTDTGKPQISLVPLEVLESVARVMEYGNTKYTRDNWREAIKTDDGIRRIKDALLRHLIKALKDTGSIDPESQQTHLAHALTNLMFLACVDN